jgi:hypothetical protein
MGDNVRIEKMANGYTIRMTDPKIVKANEARDFSKKNAPRYRDPEREFVFTDIDKVLAWLKLNLDKALPEDDFSSSFDACCAAGDD